MPAELNFFDTYTLMAVQKRIVPKQTFFRDRYFPTEEGDIFSSNKVLTEYMDGDRKMAAFVSPRVGAIPMERTGYKVHEFEPASIGVSRPLTSDDLTKRGFGEAIYANSTPAQRAAKLVQNDLADMDGRITRTEEWMCAQTMLDNGCVMQEMIDNVTEQDATWAPVPEKFEAGTQDAAGIYATAAAVAYVESVGIDVIEAREKALVAYCMEELGKLGFVTIIGHPNADMHHGVVSFNVNGIHPHDVASILDMDQVAIRAGHHCAQPLLTWLGVENLACCRASLAFYNDKGDVDKLVAGLNRVWSMFHGE